jgi:ribosomal protein L34E
VADRLAGGRLVAIDGPDSLEIAKAASTLHERLERHRVPVLVSRWDASGLFTDVAVAPADRYEVSLRTLLLLYAADLAFRMRWEIEPAMASGHIVIAAPYVTTAVTFGAAAGLSATWVQTVLRFAPTPTDAVVLKERGDAGAWRRRPERGFCDCCTALLGATPRFRRKQTRKAMVDALAKMARPHGGVSGRRRVRELVAELVTRDGRPAAAKSTHRPAG